MTPHAPKTAALEALAADLLSDEGTRRIRKHLRECEVCRDHFATIHVYRESQEFIRTSEPEVAGRPVDWSKIELALAREARTQAQLNAKGANAKTATAKARAVPPAANDGRYPWLLGGAVAVAATVLVGIGLSGWLSPAPSPRPRPDIVATTEPTPAPEPVHAPALARLETSGLVSLVAGDAQFASDFADSATEEVTVGQRLARGTVMTGERSQAQFVLELPAATGPLPAGPLPTGAEPGSDGPTAIARVAVGANAQLTFGEVSEETADRRSAITRLVRGRTTVDAFEHDSRVVVLAGSYRVEIQAARCTIDLDDDTARVSVAERDPERGEVVVVTPDGERHELGAGAGASAGASGAPEATWASRDTARALLEPLPLAALEGALLELSFPEAVRFEIGEQSFEGGPELALRVAPGTWAVRAFDGAGRAYRAQIDVGPEGLALTPDRLQPVRPHVVGFLPPEDITPIVQRSQRAIQRCYEQALRLHPTIGGGLFRARVTLDSHGAVRLVEVTGEGPVPPVLEACVRQEAAHWAFPPPGGPMTFDLPLRFHARQ